MPGMDARHEAIARGSMDAPLGHFLPKTGDTNG